MTLGNLLGVLRDAYCRTIGVEYMHIQNTEEQRWIQSNVEGVHFELSKEQQAPHPRAAERRRGVREVPRDEVRRDEAVRARGRGERDPRPRRDPVQRRRRRTSTARCSAWPTAAASTCSANIMGKSYDAIFKEFEGHLDPSSVQGSGDVKYHLGATGKYESPAGADIRIELAANPSHLETVDPIVMGMVRAQQDQIEPPGVVLGAADPDPRRRGVRRPGRRGGVPRDERHRRVPHRRHDPPDHQQPDRVHHRAAARSLVALLQRRRQDRPGADLPRQRRRPRGVRARRPARVRVPPAVPQGRRDRHGLLPPPRAQRGRRSELHAAADVQGDRRAPQRPQAVRRGARQARRHHARGGREGARRLPAEAAGGARRDARARSREGQGGAAAGAGRRAAARRHRRRPRDARPRSSPT